MTSQKGQKSGGEVIECGHSGRMSELVFVYGTLRRGGSAVDKMSGAEHLGTATLYGRLHDLGWYPGLVLDPAGGEVKGDLYAIPEMLLPVLDRYEGCSVSDSEPHEYQRLLSSVVTSDGALCSAWVYEMQRDISDLPHIECGDWIKYCAAQEKSP